MKNDEMVEIDALHHWGVADRLRENERRGEVFRGDLLLDRRGDDLRGSRLRGLLERRSRSKKSG